MGCSGYHDRRTCVAGRLIRRGRSEFRLRQLYLGLQIFKPSFDIVYLIQELHGIAADTLQILGRMLKHLPQRFHQT